VYKKQADFAILRCFSMGRRKNLITFLSAAVASYVLVTFVLNRKIVCTFKCSQEQEKGKHVTAGKAKSVEIGGQRMIPNFKRSSQKKDLQTLRTNASKPFQSHPFPKSKPSVSVSRSLPSLIKFKAGKKGISKTDLYRQKWARWRQIRGKVETGELPSTVEVERADLEAFGLPPELSAALVATVGERPRAFRSSPIMAVEQLAASTDNLPFAMAHFFGNKSCAGLPYINRLRTDNHVWAVIRDKGGQFDGGKRAWLYSGHVDRRLGGKVGVLFCN